MEVHGEKNDTIYQSSGSQVRGTFSRCEWFTRALILRGDPFVPRHSSLTVPSMNNMRLLPEAAFHNKTSGNFTCVTPTKLKTMPWFWSLQWCSSFWRWMFLCGKRQPPHLLKNSSLAPETIVIRAWVLLLKSLSSRWYNSRWCCSWCSEESFDGMKL